VGAHGNDDAGSYSGSGYIFNYESTSWSEEAKLTTSDAAFGDVLGISVSIDGDQVILGACNDDDDGSLSGSAYIFGYNGTNWSEEMKLTASDAAANDRFGISVSINGDRAIVGAFGNNDAGSYSGSAYVYELKFNIIDYIQNLVTLGILNKGQGNSLIVKMEASNKHISKGNSTPAINLLEAFINQVNAFINTGILSLEQGQELIDAAEDIIDDLQSGLPKQGIKENAILKNIPKYYTLSQNYPNPFNPTTTIKYSIPRQSFVKLIIFDALGKEISTPVSKEQPQGLYEVEFDGSNLSSGIYFYLFRAGNYIETKTMILLK
ncbi:T9SS type A sorting domain-containing protein, partial [Bacteroidota bacterium]